MEYKSETAAGRRSAEQEFLRRLAEKGAQLATDNCFFYQLRAPCNLPFPPRLPVLDSELFWLDPFAGCSELRVSSEEGGKKPKGEAGETPPIEPLIERALHEPLSPEEQKTLLQHIALKGSSPWLLSTVTPHTLPGLVESNPEVASAVLLQQLDSPLVAHFLESLLTMRMSLPSMEVVTRLLSLVDLPPEFLHAYVAECVAQCQGCKDKNMQSRLVRMLCVFLHNVIRSGASDVQALLVELQSFCIEFSRIKEAAQLFKLLKAMD